MSTTLTPPSGLRTDQPSRPDVPDVGRARVRRDLTLASRFSLALVVVAAIASAVGAVYPDIFRDTPMTTGNVQGTALVILVVAVPTVVVSMRLAARGSLRAQIVWLGALSYILYNAVNFAYGIHFNSLFLLYTTMLGLAFWSVVTLILAIDVEAVRAHFAPGTPARVFAGYLVLFYGAFVLLWLLDIVPGILQNTAPEGLKDTGMITDPVKVTDFAFSFPLIAVAVFWLWQRRAWGYLLSGLFLVFGVIEAISVASDQLFAHFHDASLSAGAVPVFAVVSLIGLGVAVAYLRYLHADPAPSTWGLETAGL